MQSYHLTCVIVVLFVALVGADVRLAREIGPFTSQVDNVDKLSISGYNAVFAGNTVRHPGVIFDQS